METTGYCVSQFLGDTQTAALLNWDEPAVALRSQTLVAKYAAALSRSCGGTGSRLGSGHRARAEEAWGGPAGDSSMLTAKIIEIRSESSA